KSRIFTTASDGQTVVEVHILQGERELAAHNKSLGKFELRNIPPAQRGIPQIEVTFEIDANGIVNVSAKDLATGNKQKITIQSPTNLTQDEVDKMVKEAEVHAHDDAKYRESVQIKNQAKSEIDIAERTLLELGDKLSNEKLKSIRAAIERLRVTSESYELDRIKQDTKALTDELFTVSSDLYTKIKKETPAASKNEVSK
ncbi:MAG: Hsp70 family protein, partial [Armatimonadetes bacterium]|nr:Hsp70 family protein [Armatimonadota bacterium]